MKTLSTHVTKSLKKLTRFFNSKTKYVSFFTLLTLISCSTNQQPVIPDSKNSNKIKKDRIELLKRISMLDLTFIAPSSGISAQQDHDIRSLCNLYKISIPSSATFDSKWNFCSDTVENRVKYISQAVKSHHNIVWAIGGGFGATLLLSDLNKLPRPQKNKTLIGFSDITALHLFTSQKWNWKAIHAPVFKHLFNKEFSKDNFEILINILEGKIKSYDIDKLYPINIAATKANKKNKHIQGKITGGNLTLVEASIGTCWQIKARNKILFLEDVNIKPWSIYRSLYHLKESGQLKGIKALVLGCFTKSGFSNETIKNTLKEFAETLDIPVYVTDQFGHETNNVPIVYNAVGKIKGNKMTLTIHQKF